jgi:uncharacterized integral membrane protein (TIGR00697 family)
VFLLKNYLYRKRLLISLWLSDKYNFLIGTIFQQGAYQGLASLSVFSLFVFRIALASFVAYAVGQLMDIFVFQRLREKSQWWLAPAASTTAGNLIDTFIFYSVAFYQTTDPYMAENWFSLGCVDFVVKMLAGLLIFVPMYGMFLSVLLKVLGAKNNES